MGWEFSCGNGVSVARGQLIGGAHKGAGEVIEGGEVGGVGGFVWEVVGDFGLEEGLGEGL